jgi:DNA-binding transcriptional LysR family regulator
VEELIVAGFGVGLLPSDQKPMRGVSVVPVRDPDVTLRSYAATRRGRENWPPLALIARELRVIGEAPG